MNITPEIARLYVLARKLGKVEHTIELRAIADSLARKERKEMFKKLDSPRRRKGK